MDKDGGKGGDESGEKQTLPPPIVGNIPRPLSPTKLTPVGRCHFCSTNENPWRCANSH